MLRSDMQVLEEKLAEKRAETSKDKEVSAAGAVSKVPTSTTTQGPHSGHPVRNEVI